ncbi:MAG: hypothetical protein V1672_04720 [Candidatus Diapherotrites archaeon]
MIATGIPELDAIINQIFPYIEANLLTVVTQTIAIVIYGVAIFHFYRFVARKDVFGFDMTDYLQGQKAFLSKITDTFAGAISYGLVFPLFVFLWFMGFAILLFFLTRTTDIPQILLISIAIVSAIRITAYYSEDLSKDLAKMLPFALLAIAIVEPSFFTTATSLANVMNFQNHIPQIIGFAVIVILLEWTLRIFVFVKRALFGVEIKKEKLEAEGLEA